jgi:hypothetical protein
LRSHIVVAMARGHDIDAAEDAAAGGVIDPPARRLQRVGIANIHYLRHDRFFVLLATHGHHPFYDDEAGNIRDARRVPIKFAGYATDSEFVA